MTTDSHKTLNTIITALTLQKKKLEGRLYPLTDTIFKRTQSVSTLDEYFIEYKEQIYNTAYHTSSSYQNSQQFLEKLSSVLYSEKEALSRLQQQKTELLQQYHVLNQKIEGLQEMLLLRKQTANAAYESNEDLKRTELATTRAFRQRIEDNQ